MPLDSNREYSCPSSKLHADLLFHQTTPVFVLVVRPRASESGWLDFIVDNSSQEVLYSAHKVGLLSLFVASERSISQLLYPTHSGRLELYLYNL